MSSREEATKKNYHDLNPPPSLRKDSIADIAKRSVLELAQVEFAK